jgi:transcriptional regulator with PAS, ATPase and Fis domain
MPRRAPDPELTNTSTDAGGAEVPRVVPVLFVLGDARTLSASRAVVRIEGTLEIGRSPDATGEKVWILEDDRVSRRHVEIKADATRGSAQITDLGSRNGTIVDGRSLGTEPVQLASGSMIFIGTHAAVFRFVLETDLHAITEDLATPFTPVSTISPELARRSQMLRHLARGGDDLLLVGETGVGKEEFARGIHQASGRPGKFVAINCPALPGSLIESELFGYVKGAHSQAGRDKPGLIDEAEHGTLFLDELAEIAPEVQAKLLRFLEDRQLTALGSTKPRRADVRILAATNRDLSALRQDIAARLGPEPIRLPPLRNHREDLAALAAHFLRERGGITLDVPAFQALCLHGWPDNIRELKKVLGRAADLAAAQERTVIGLEHLPESLGRRRTAEAVPVAAGEMVPAAARRSPRAAPTKEELLAVLERHDWVVSKAARELDRDHAVVWRWIKRYDLDASRARSEEP